jgi:hypothetical protein
MLGSAAAGPVVSVLDGIVNPVIADIQRRLGDNAFSQTAEVVMLVTHHVAGADGECTPTTTTPTTTQTNGAGCLVGTWVSTGETGPYITGGGAGVVLRITDAGKTTFDYTADYDAEQPVQESIAGEAGFAKQSGTERGTLRPVRHQLNRQFDVSGVTTTVTIAGRTTVSHGAPGLHPAPGESFDCTSTILTVMGPSVLGGTGTWSYTRSPGA